MFRPKNILKDSLPTKIIFEEFNTKTQKFGPDGSLKWNGFEWIVNEENAYGSMAIKLKFPKVFDDQVLTKNDRNFYEPHYYIPTTGTRVSLDPPLSKQK